MDKLLKDVCIFEQYLQKQAEVVDRFDISYGYCGFASFYYWKFQLTGKDSDLEYFYLYTERAINMASNPSSPGFIFIDLAELTFFLDFHQDLLAKRFELACFKYNAREALLSYSRESIKGGNVDPYTGGFFQAYYFLQQGGNESYLESLVQEIADGQIALDWGTATKRDSVEQGTLQLGITHGLAFFLLFVTICHEKNIAREHTLNLMGRLASQILAQEQPQEVFGSFFPDMPGNKGRSPLNLCYGDAGILYALVRASAWLQEVGLQSELVKMLIHTGRRINEPSIASHSILYGDAGRYLFFNRIQRFVQVEELSTATDFWLHEFNRQTDSFSLSSAHSTYYGPTTKRQISLLEGWTGYFSIKMSEQLGRENELNTLTYLI